MRRSTVALPLALAATIALAACAGSPPADPEADPTADPAASICDSPSGDAVESVSVTGDFGVQPTVVTPSEPLELATTERAVLIEGDGDTTAEGDVLEVAYTVVNATSGTTIEAYGYADGEQAQFVADAAQQLEGVARTIGCLPVGSRVVGVVPPSEAFGTAGSTDLGIAADDVLIFVVDILGVVPTRAWGVDQPTPAGLPVVTLDEETGAPSVEIPAGDPPAELQIGVLKLGDGPVVGSADTVTLQYHGVQWSDGSVFDESWPSPTSFSVLGVVEGFSAALVGQTVGSQVIVVIPPALGYGEAGTSDHALAGQTLVFVIDILDTQS